MIPMMMEKKKSLRISIVCNNEDSSIDDANGGNGNYTDNSSNANGNGNGNRSSSTRKSGTQDSLLSDSEKKLSQKDHKQKRKEQGGGKMNDDLAIEQFEMRMTKHVS